ncbi:MAG: acyl carrier protein [Parashewanella sp.]
MKIESELKSILAEVLSIETNAFDKHTELLGAIPELDSMAIMLLLVEIEGRLGISVSDDLDAEAFETFGSLIEFFSHEKA